MKVQRKCSECGEPRYRRLVPKEGYPMKDSMADRDELIASLTRKLYPEGKRMVEMLPDYSYGAKASSWKEHLARYADQMLSAQREAMLRLLDELEVGFANNPKHRDAVIYRVREAVEKGQPLPTEAFARSLR
jgi:hypothetical protein